MPRPDLTGRTLYRCDGAKCPYPGKRIDLTAGSFTVDDSGAYHNGCYAEEKAPKPAAAQTAKEKAAKDADAAVQKAYDDAVAEAQKAALVAAWQARKEQWEADPANSGVLFPERDPRLPPAQLEADDASEPREAAEAPQEDMYVRVGPVPPEPVPPIRAEPQGD